MGVGLSKAEERALLDNLARLGGKTGSDSDILFEGTKLVIPEGMTLERAAEFIHDRIEQDEKATRFVRDFPYRPWDGAHATYEVLRQMFGMVGALSTYSFFGGEEPPARITINVSANERKDVPWGVLTVPFLKRTKIMTEQVDHDEWGPIFRLVVVGPRKYRAEVEGLFRAIELYLGENSIYRSKAFDGRDMPEFLDLAGIDPSRIVYSEDVATDLDAHIWAPMRLRDEHIRLGLPLKRAVLLAGPYGTGKSEAARLTAMHATQNGWAFIHVRPGRDNFGAALQTARLYQPAVVFFEDAETVASAEGNDSVSYVLDLFDGITAKGTQLMVVMTTNRPEAIHRGMMRPGRLDAVIHINGLDDAGIERLIRRNIPEEALDPDTDFTLVAESCADYTPAFVKEVADRAVRYALRRSDGNVSGMLISTVDLVAAAKGIRPQFDAMNEAPEEAGKEPLSLALTRTVKRAVADLASPETVKQGLDHTWDPQAVKSARNGGAH